MPGRPAPMRSGSIGSACGVGQPGFDGVGDLVGERARRRQRRLLLERGWLGEAERVDRVTQQRGLELQRVTILMAQPATDPAQHPEHLPCPDELGSAPGQAGGELGLEVGDRAEAAGDGQGLQQLRGVPDGREQVELPRGNYGCFLAVFDWGNYSCFL